MQVVRFRQIVVEKLVYALRDKQIPRREREVEVTLLGWATLVKLSSHWLQIS